MTKTLKELREWWIDPTPCDDEMGNIFDAFSKEPEQGPIAWRSSLIRVVKAEPLLTRIEKQDVVISELVKALEFYGNRNNWKADSYSSDCKEVISFSDLGCKSFNGENDFADYAVSSGGRRAREVLASSAIAEWKESRK